MTIENGRLEHNVSSTKSKCDFMDKEMLEHSIARANTLVQRLSAEINRRLMREEALDIDVMLTDVCIYNRDLFL